MLLFPPLAVLFMLQTSPVSTSPAPDGINPAVWAFLIGAAVVALELGRRYVNGRIDARIETERARLALETKKYESDSTIRMETIRGDNAQQQADAEGLRLLAASIEKMATTTSNAYQNLASDRQQAALERQEFRMTLDGNTTELRKHADELLKLRVSVETLATSAADILNQIKAIQTRIGGSENDPPLTKLVSEAAEAAKQAAAALAKAEQEVTPTQVVIVEPIPTKNDLPSSTPLAPTPP